MIISVFDRVENIVGKGENACYQHFLLFPQCFEKTFFQDTSKVVIVWEWVKRQNYLIKWKTFADDKFNIIEMIISGINGIEENWENEEVLDNGIFSWTFFKEKSSYCHNQAVVCEWVCIVQKLGNFICYHSGYQLETWYIYSLLKGKAVWHGQVTLKYYLPIHLPFWN